jgi:hypothetical protein
VRILRTDFGVPAVATSPPPEAAAKSRKLSADEANEIQSVISCRTDIRVTRNAYGQTHKRALVKSDICSKGAKGALSYQPGT